MDFPALSGDASQALDRARGLARERGSDRAETVDVLLALLESPQAVRLLELFGGEPEPLRAGLTFILQRPAWQTDADAEDRTVDLARAEADRLGQAEAGSEHLLLALVREPGSVASGLLYSMGMTLDSARQAVRYLHGQVPGWQRPPATEVPSRVTAWAPMEAVPSSMFPDVDTAEMLDVAMDLGEVHLSPLVRVIGIGQGVKSSDVLVELIALEIRESGALLHWRTETAEDGLPGQPDITVADDAGTTYNVFPESVSGGGREARGEARITPRPPDTAKALHIEVRSFEDLDWI